MLGMESNVWLLAHLKASLLRVHPTAMGRKPPDFLQSAVSRAPKRSGRITFGVLPSRMSVTKPASDLNKSWPPSPADWLDKSLRC